MPLEEHNLPNRDEILKMEKLSQKILSYEFSSKRKASSLSPPLEEEVLVPIQAAGYSSKSDTTKTLALFRKYLHKKAQQAMERTYDQESKAMRPHPKLHRNFVSLKDPTSPREISMLEKILSPSTSQSSRSTSTRSFSNEQLTIFYSGSVTVFDNVPADKAQAILLLAGKSSSLDSAITSAPTMHTLPVLSEPTSESNRQIFSENSLRRFNERRRDRIVTSSPCEYQTTRQDIQGGN